MNLAKTDIASEVISLVALGFTDSVSLHRSIPVLTSDRAILTALGKCLAVNTILLLGSLYAHDKVFLPATTIISDLMSNGEPDAGSGVYDFSGQCLTVIYTSCWVVPIWGLCYLLSLQWYQEISQELARSKNSAGGKPKLDVKSQIVKECYVFVAWLVLYFATSALLFGVPKVLILALNVSEISLAFFSDSAVAAATLSCIRLVANSLRYASRASGFILQSVCYGWYGFDYHWSAAGHDYKLRFKRVEDHWAYFVGYGLPYVFIISQSTFFVGFGIYLILFPITLILSAESNFEVSSSGVSVPAVRVFKLPGHFASTIIKFVLQSSGRSSQNIDSKKYA